MRCFSIVLLFCYATSVIAEHTEKRNQVYSAQAQHNADNLNQATEILRNPTIMSGNFRQALKSIKPDMSDVSASTFNSNNNAENDMPFIELVAKVLAADKPSTVVLRVNDHTLHLIEGNTASQLVNRKIINIRVDKITDDGVTIFLSPFDQVMFLQ